MEDENVFIFNNLYAKNPRHNSLKVCVCVFLNSEWKVYWWFTF